MKKIVFALALLVSFAGIAQKKDGDKRDHKKPRFEQYTPEQMATLQTKELTLALDLNKNQQEKIMALTLENAKLRQEKMEQFKSMKEKGEKPEKPTVEQRFEMRNAMLDHQIAQQQKMKDILSEKQFAEWTKMKKNKKRKMREFRKDRHYSKR